MIAFIWGHKNNIRQILTFNQLDGSYSVLKKPAPLPAILASRKPTDSDEGKSLFTDGLRKE